MVSIKVTLTARVMGYVTRRTYSVVRLHTFLLAIVVYLCVGIIADKFVDDIIMEPIAIAKHYLKTWFFVDLVSSIPLDYIIVALSPDTSATQVMHAGMFYQHY